MESTKTLIQFLQALKPDLLDPNQYIDQITDLIDYLSREKCSSNSSYLVEIPKEQFQAWLKFKESYFVADTPTTLPPKSQSMITIKTLAI